MLLESLNQEYQLDFNENSFVGIHKSILSPEINIEKGIKVKILTGKDKNKDGEVIEIDRPNNRAKVKGINLVKKHIKTTKEKKGGIFSKENFLHISNIKIIQDAKKNKKTEIKK